MAQPDPYARDFDFTALAPSEVPEVGTRLDGEFDAIGAVVDQIRDSLVRIQRDDGALKNLSVHPDALSARTRTLIGGGWALRGAWVTDTLYQAKDVVSYSGTLYVCLVKHTSGTFATDLTAENWLVWYAESMIPGAGTIEASMLSPSFLLPLAKLASFLSTGTGAVARTVPDRLEEDVYLTDFGADRTGTSPIDTAWANAVARAEAVSGTLIVPRGNFRANATLVFTAQNAKGIRMEGNILSYETAAPALVIGTDSATAGAYNQSKRYTGLSVERATQSDWSDEAEIGIRLINADNCHVEITRAEKFAIGVQLYGGLRGCEDSRYHLGRLTDCKVGLDLHCATSGSWANSNAFFGGHFANQSATNILLDRFGVRLSFAVGAYNRHNANRFYSPAFELQRQGTPGTVSAIPFLIEADDARAIEAYGIRMEQCSPYVARHLGGAQGGALDCVYHVGYVGTYGFEGCAVQYSGADRSGGTVVPMHQAGASVGSPRLVADMGNPRTRAFRWARSSTAVVSPDHDGMVAESGFLVETGFDQMAVLSSNPSGPPTTLTGFAFPGLTFMSLVGDTVVLPTSRALAFIVDARLCKEFFIAAEGDNLRPVIMQFDGSENVLDSATPAMLSNMSITYAGSPSYWWEGNANLDSLTGGVALNRLQRVTLHSSCTYAAIGIRGGVAGAVLRAFRLYVGATHSPALLYGGARAWGERELKGNISGWTPPDLASGAVAQFTATTADQMDVTGARTGDEVAVSYTMSAGSQNGGVIFSGSVSVANQVSISLHNQSAGTIQLDGGATNTVDVFATVRKRRL